MSSQPFPASSSFVEALEALPEPQRSIERSNMRHFLQTPENGLEGFLDLGTFTPRDNQHCFPLASSFMPTPAAPTNQLALISPYAPVAPTPTAQTPSKELTMAEIDRRLSALEAAIANLELAPTKRRKRPTKVSGEVDSSLPPGFTPATGGVNPANLKKHQLDENEVDIKPYLAKATRMQMYAIMQYKHGATMPCLGEGIQPNDPNLLWPDFRKNIHAPENRLLQMRAVAMVLDQEKARPDRVPEEYRKKWVNSSVLLEFARHTWPHMKQVWIDQQRAKTDDGKARREKASDGRRAERRRTRASQLRDAVIDFCAEHKLDDEVVQDSLVQDDWVGEEWSCDEDYSKSSFKQKLFEQNRITEEELAQDDETFGVLEIKRPAWMNIETWNWYQSLHAKHMRKQARNGRPGAKPGRRVDLGNLSKLVPRTLANDFMLDADWVRDDLPFYPDLERTSGMPRGVPEHIARLINSSL